VKYSISSPKGIFKKQKIKMKIIHVHLPKVMSNFCYYRKKIFIYTIHIFLRSFNKKKKGVIDLNSVNSVNRIACYG